MEGKQRLFVDMDGTLCVFTPTDTIETLYEQGYFADLKPHENVVGAIRKIIEEHPEIEVNILSAYLADSEYALQEKNDWLDGYLPEIDKEHRIFTPCGNNKKEAVPGGIRKDDCLLDDYTLNLQEWALSAKGIKLLNGINHTRGSWSFDRVSYKREPENMAEAITGVMKGQKKIYDWIDKYPMPAGELDQRQLIYEYEIYACLPENSRMMKWDSETGEPIPKRSEDFVFDREIRERYLQIAGEMAYERFREDRLNYFGWRKELTESAIGKSVSELERQAVGNIRRGDSVRGYWEGIVASPENPGDHIRINIRGEVPKDRLFCSASLVLHGKFADSVRITVSRQELFGHGESEFQKVVKKKFAKRLSPGVNYESYVLYVGVKEWGDRSNTLDMFYEMLKAEGIPVPLSEVIKNREETRYGIYSDVGSVLDGYTTEALSDYYVNVLGNENGLRDYLKDQIIADEINRLRMANDKSMAASEPEDIEMPRKAGRKR